MKKIWVRSIIFVAAMAVLGVLAFSGVVMLLWNSTVATVFHIGAISIWQAAGLLLLAKILFGGRRGGRRMYGRCGDQNHRKWQRVHAV